MFTTSTNHIRTTLSILWMIVISFLFTNTCGVPSVIQVRTIHKPLHTHCIYSAFIAYTFFSDFLLVNDKKVNQVRSPQRLQNTSTHTPLILCMIAWLWIYLCGDLCDSDPPDHKTISLLHTPCNITCFCIRSHNWCGQIKQWPTYIYSTTLHNPLQHLH